MASGHVAEALFATNTIKTGRTVTLTSITRVTTTATATLVDHGLRTGATVTIAGCVQTNYNGAFTITVTGADTFTYTVTNTGASPATTLTAITATGADQAVYNSTTLTDDAQLTAPILGGESFEYDFTVFYSNTDDTTDGMTVSVTAPANSTGYFHVLSPDVVATKAVAFGTGIALGSNSLDGIVQVRHIKAVVHSPIAGNVTLQFAQTNAASATQAVVYAGSMLRASKLFSTLVV